MNRMTRRSKIWLAAGGLWTAINVAGAGYAAMMGEPLHAAAHVLALLLGVVVVREFAPRSAATESHLSDSAESGIGPGPITDRLTNLEQSLDAVAIEVDRIVEGQREMTRLFIDDGVARDDGTGAANPVKVDKDRSSS